MSTTTHSAECFCGAIKFTVSGSPEGMGFCHCDSCRSWSASPVNSFSLWQPNALEIIAGAAHVAEYHKTKRSYRKFCALCGSHLMTDHPELGLVDVFAAMLPTLDFQPGLHVHYGEKVLSLPDGLPKYQDMPEAIGGTGILINE